MAEVIWTEPALADLDAIADYIALDKPAAARALVQRIFQHVEQLAKFPESGSAPPELSTSLGQGRKDLRSRYRQLVEPPCRIFYRFNGTRVFILYVMRSEMRLRRSRLRERDRRSRKA